MATRHHIEQPRAAIPAPKKKLVDGKAEANKTRRALGEIGNVVVPTIPQGKEINRPITRSFGAKLLANAQAQAQAPGPRPVKLPPSQNQIAPKPVTKRPVQAAAKQPIIKQKEVIEISSANSLLNKRKTKKREVHSLTSVLSARSKVASGIKQRQIDEIDLPDITNQYAVVEYIDDMYTFYKEQELICRPVEYMDKQVEINPKMRAILADWIIEVHHKFELMPETLYLSIYIIDRFLSMEFVPRRQLQLVGIASMLIACKYEEIWAPEVTDFIHISDNSYSREQILGKEKEILNRLEWYLTIPTPYMFLVRFVKAASADKELEHMIYFYAELGMMQYSTVKYCPSLLAASAVYTARSTLQKSPLWTETLIRHTGYTEIQLQECVRIMAGGHIEAPQSKLKVVYKKYSLEQFGKVALKEVSESLKAGALALKSGGGSGTSSSSGGASS